MAAVIDICRDGIVCRNSKRMWKCGVRRVWNEAAESFDLLEPKTFRFSLGLLIYTSYRFSTIYARLPQYFWMRNVCSLHKHGREIRVTGKRY